MAQAGELAAPSPTLPAVSVVVLGSAWGGLEQVALADAFAALRLGHRVRLITHADSRLEHEARRAAAALDRSQQARWECESLRPPTRNWLDLGLRRALRSACAAGYTTVHLHQSSLLGSVVPWLERSQRLVVSRHIWAGHRQLDPYHRWLHARVDAWVAVSEAHAANLREQYGLESSRVRVIRLGVTPARAASDRVRALRAAWGAPGDVIVVGLVGRLDPAKGQHELLTALERLSSGAIGAGAKFPWRAVMVGAESPGLGGHFEAELRARAQSLGLADRIVWTGHSQEVEAVFAALDIAVMPSHQETFGMVALEAMAAGRPVIVADGPSAAELVGVGAEAVGIRVAPRDADALAHALVILMSDVGLRARLGDLGRRRVLAEFSAQARVEQTSALYRPGG